MCICIAGRRLRRERLTSSGGLSGFLFLEGFFQTHAMKGERDT